MASNDMQGIFDSLAIVLRPKSRLCYWNFLVDRSNSSANSSAITPLRELSRDLWQRDRSWLYRAFYDEA